MEEKEEEEIIRREEEEREGRVKKDWGWGHELTFFKLYLVLWVVVCILQWQEYSSSIMPVISGNGVSMYYAVSIIPTYLTAQVLVAPPLSPNIQYVHLYSTKKNQNSLMFNTFFVPRVSYTVLGYFTLLYNYIHYTIIGRMPGFEPELLRPQPGVQPMSFTHSSIKLKRKYLLAGHSKL